MDGYTEYGYRGLEEIKQKEKQGIEINQLISMANKHPRVNILKPGCGVGGHCIAVDPWFLISQNLMESNLQNLNFFQHEVLMILDIHLPHKNN